MNLFLANLAMALSHFPGRLFSHAAGMTRWPMIPGIFECFKLAVGEADQVFSCMPDSGIYSRFHQQISEKHL